MAGIAIHGGQETVCGWLRDRRRSAPRRSEIRFFVDFVTSLVVLVVKDALGHNKGKTR